MPIIYSLNRGLWIGLIVALAYLGLRLAARGQLAVLGALLAAVAIAAVVIASTPLQGVISQRLSSSGSVDRRGSLSAAAVHDAVSSPLIGYGDTRHPQGSIQSVAVGTIGQVPGLRQAARSVRNGQLWLLLICSGFLGTALYLSFFAYGCWRYWRDTTAYGLAGVLVLLLSFVFMIAYVAVGAPLAFTMLAYALLWRNERAIRQEQAVAAGSAVPLTAVQPPGRVRG